VQADDAGDLKAAQGFAYRSSADPSFSAKLAFGRSLSPGRSEPAAISRRTCSQISSNTRLVRIGAKRGCDRSFAARR